jgi:hypothetical protein
MAVHVDPTDIYSSNWYRRTPPVRDLRTGYSAIETFPHELVPGYYTYNRL